MHMDRCQCMDLGAFVDICERAGSGVQAGMSEWEAERNEGLESRSTSVNIWSALHHSHTQHTSPRSHPH